MNFILSRMLYEIKINFKKATCDESLVRCIYMYDSDRYLYLALLSALLLCSFASRMQLNNCFSFVNYILRDELFVTQYSTLVECLLASHLKNTTQIRFVRFQTYTESTSSACTWTMLTFINNGSLLLRVDM